MAKKVARRTAKVVTADNLYNLMSGMGGGGDKGGGAGCQTYGDGGADHGHGQRGVVRAWVHQAQADVVARHAIALAGPGLRGIRRARGQQPRLDLWRAVRRVHAEQQ